MSVIVNLAPDTERKLREVAAHRGLTIEEYLGQLAAESAASTPAAPKPSPTPSEQTPEQRVAAWRAWVASHRNQTRVADDSRESIYEGRGE
jgi:hypothetical protein